ncbi:MAG: flagellar biosynthesis anti-sigma factor FlgM [Betaproteobacteria bacterium]|jgi:negative regulator of flagellin synthesis FlgM|nr:flagellar biosynthesis anti-sigma factor FlgM [Burkholderiaceae bacterium]MCZ8112390.1 flagellar biosynthesis anti-sigma factor FlgM [Rubrivivax sp.]MCZ8176143.1 flagellar biosynthesis anti-sigma factor FlgM [Burkholderiaceae bacterium]
MKIGPLEPKTIAAPATAERKAAPQPASAEPSAQVKLSSAAQSLQAAEGDPTFDTAKVERIAQAIRDGQFKVNPEAIADKLIVNAQELLSRKPS